VTSGRGLASRGPDVTGETRFRGARPGSHRYALLMTTLVHNRPRRGRRTAAARRPAAPLTLLTWNIAAAGAERASHILSWLLDRTEDVIVLTETSKGPGTALIAEGLRGAGYTVQHVVDPTERGVLLASRVRISRDLATQVDVTLRCRATSVVLATRPRPITLVGVYIPSRDRSEKKIARKEAFVRSLLRGLNSMPRNQLDRLVVTGDYNVVARRHEPPLPGFFPWEYDVHEELERIGLRAAHELKPSGKHPHSWIGRTGLGYLYDYVHIGRGLHRGVETCEYLHAPRESRLSDHAAVSVCVRMD
jgi:exodeoxyribonuclease III